MFPPGTITIALTKFLLCQANPTKKAKYTPTDSSMDDLDFSQLGKHSYDPGYVAIGEH